MAITDNLRTAFTQWFDCSPVTIAPTPPPPRCTRPATPPPPAAGDFLFTVTDDLHDVIFNVDVNPSVPDQLTVTVTNPRKGRVFQDTLSTQAVDTTLLRDRILLAGEQLLLVARDKDQYDWLS